jgi:geranylgeranyl diphosphate synthase type I
MAILVGGLAMAWADDLIHDALEDLTTRSAARAVWREMRTEVMAGQFLDLRSQARGELSENNALRVDLLKTATYTVERPLHLGAAMSGAPAETVAALRGYGGDVGVAFQLRDDLLDVYGDPARTGKEPGEDLREGRNTLLPAARIRLARQQGDNEALRILRRAGGPRRKWTPPQRRTCSNAWAPGPWSNGAAANSPHTAWSGSPLRLGPAVHEGLRSFAETASRA